MPLPELKFGIYLTPFHPPQGNPTIALQRNLQLLELLDQLGYDTAWIGEHDSAGVEADASAEVFIAAAAERTRRIALGIAVSSLPRHDPLISDERMIPVSVASQVSPAGASLAGTHGLDLLSLSATSPGGFNALAVTWEIYERKARESNQPIDRNRWSLAGPVHIAESREQAFEDIRYGIDAWLSHFREVADLPVAPNGQAAGAAQALVASGMAVIGTTDDAIRQLNRLQTQSGGFGAFLQMAHNWADGERTRKSYQLFARHVAPVFQSTNYDVATGYQPVRGTEN